MRGRRPERYHIDLDEHNDGRTIDDEHGAADRRVHHHYDDRGDDHHDDDRGSGDQRRHCRLRRHPGLVGRIGLAVARRR